MADLINLRQFKKRIAREETQKQAVQHRREFGKTKAERLFDLRQKEQQFKFLQNNVLIPKDDQ